MFMFCTRIAEAVRIYSEALALAPHSAALHTNRAAALLAADLPAGALKDAQVAVHLEPGSAKAHYRLAAAHAALGEWRAALQAAQRADGMWPGDASIQNKVVEYRTALEADEAAVGGQRAVRVLEEAGALQAARQVTEAHYSFLLVLSNVFNYAQDITSRCDNNYCLPWQRFNFQTALPPATMCTTPG